jgi:peroxiredoxin Q/BCP
MKMGAKVAIAVGIAVAVGVGGFAYRTATQEVVAIEAGERAPDFTLLAAKAGQDFSFNLNNALKQGPVVLYFFPAAFTPGCTVEANLFAEATDEFASYGAQVVGVTAGNIDRVQEFSRSECRDKFAVAADVGAKVAAQYDATYQVAGKDMMSSRTSFVIAPDGKILLSHTDKKPQSHISETMAAVKAWKAQQV